MVRIADRFRGMWPLSPSEKARRMHERWLNAAIGRADLSALRIPVRRVDRGGFSVVTASAPARDAAERWWIDAIDRADRMIDA